MSVERQVRVARISLAEAGALDGEGLNALRATLAVEERQQADNFHFAADRARYLMAHAALRRLLAGLLGCDAATLRFARGPFGKPSLTHPAAPDLHFNLSHSATMALVAWGDAPVGVDVEDVDRTVNEAGVAQSVFSPDEREALGALPAAARRLAFFDLWTRKEAALKALGTGLSQSAAALTLGLAATVPGGPAQVHRDPVTGQPLFVARLALGPRHCAAVASTTPFDRVEFVEA